MKRLSLYLVLAYCALAVAPIVATGAVAGSAELDGLLNRAEALVQLGVNEHGAGRSFEQALDLVDTASERLATAELPADERRSLALEIEGLREDVELLIELHEKRFFGVFPLARLTIPTFMAEEGFAVTEQLYHAPELAATEIAARSFAAKLARYDDPHLIIGSSTAERRLENAALSVFLGDTASRPVTRRQLVRQLNADEQRALETGEVTPETIRRLLEAFDAVSLVLVHVEPIVEIDDSAMKVVLQGELFVLGELVQGSQVDASPVIRAASVVAAGTVRDRRSQSWPIVGTQLLMLALALAWATRITWSLGEPLKRFYRLAIGAALFIFGRVFMLVVVVSLQKVMPDSSAPVAAAWWWPAILGLQVVLGGGILAWLGQARLTDILPSTRGARAVGTIFALTTLGAGSYFISPLLLLDGSAGFNSVVPFVASSLGLSVLFAFAARTGPPVPHYFMVGPLLAAPLLGVSLLMASPEWLWGTVGLTGVLGLLAWIRHRYAVAHGSEESEPIPEEAAAADQQRLVKLEKKLSKH